MIALVLILALEFFAQFLTQYTQTIFIKRKNSRVMSKNSITILRACFVWAEWWHLKLSKKTHHSTFIYPFPLWCLHRKCNPKIRYIRLKHSNMFWGAYQFKLYFFQCWIPAFFSRRDFWGSRRDINRVPGGISSPPGLFCFCFYHCKLYAC